MNNWNEYLKDIVNSTFRCSCGNIEFRRKDRVYWMMDIICTKCGKVYTINFNH